MSALFDFLPVIFFFIAFKLCGIYIASAVAIFAAILQAAFSFRKAGKVSPLVWISLGAVAILGGATIILKNEWFIKWKPTAVYLLFAAVLWATEKFWNKNLIRSAVGEKIKFPEKTWRAVNLSWVWFFVFIGVANVFVIFNFSTETWVNFKLFGLTALMIIFAVAQSLVLSKYAQKEEISKEI